MWFFAEFCNRYGGKLYPSVTVKATEERAPEVVSFLVFSRILLFEEIVDHYNTVMADDGSLHETIREVNRIHHKDESRHIAFGRELVAQLYGDLALDDGDRADVEDYLKRYMTSILDSFANPRAYRDAGLTDTVSLRERVLTDPGRAAARQHIARKPMAFFTRTGIFSGPELPVTA